MTADRPDDERKCAELIDKVRRSFPRPLPGDKPQGMYFAKPGLYTDGEISTAQATADRLGLNILISEGTISINPQTIDFVAQGTVVKSPP